MFEMDPQLVGPAGDRPQLHLGSRHRPHPRHPLPLPMGTRCTAPFAVDPIAGWPVGVFADRGVDGPRCVLWMSGDSGNICLLNSAGREEPAERAVGLSIER